MTDYHVFMLIYFSSHSTLASNRSENFKTVICYIDINIVEHNEIISKWPHLFKLSNPLRRYRNSKLRFIMRNSDKIRLSSQKISQ